MLKADGDSCASAKSDSAEVVASAGRTDGLWGAIFCSGEGAGVLWLGRERDGAPKACKTKMQRAASVGGGCGHGCAALESVDGWASAAGGTQAKWEMGIEKLELGIGLWTMQRPLRFSGQSRRA